MASSKRHACEGVVLMMVVLGLCVGASAGQFAGGDGSAGNPYQIATPQQLLDIGMNPQLLKQCFVLINDIDFDTHYGPTDHLVRPPIAPYEEGPAFDGWLDGQGHVIRHLRIILIDGRGCGLIGHVGPKGTILALGVEDSSVIGAWDDVGLLAGSNSGTILGCWAQGRAQGEAGAGLLVGAQQAGKIAYAYSEGVISGRQQLGGLVGRVVGGEIQACASDCRFEAVPGAVYDCGGLVGRLEQGTVADCFARANLAVPQGTLVAGLVGSNRAGTIRRCLSLGKASGQSFVAGLVSQNEGTIRSCYSLCGVQAERVAAGLVCDNRGTVMLCYAAGSVKGAQAGGLIAQGYGAFLSYWNVEQSGVLTSVGGLGRTTAQMRQPATFRGWGHEGEWLLPEGDLPRLSWEPCWGVELFDEPAPFSGGSGTTDDPYQIQTPAEWASLAWDASLLDKHFVLMQDINLAAVDPNGLLPIGTRGLAFCGSLDGRGHIISGPAFDLPANYVGLFGCVGASREDPNRAGWVKNLIVLDAQVSGRDIVGALTACQDGGRIERCFVTGRVQGLSTVGGAVGEGASGEVVECAFEGRVGGQRELGGLAGTHNGILRSCYSVGEVVGDAFGVGGLVGTLGEPYPIPSRPLVAFCYSEARVEGNGGVGGLIGVADYGEVFACYAAGRVQGHVTTTTGGLAGSAEGMVTWGNFWDRQSSGVENSAFGQAQTTAAMMNPGTYAGWEYGRQWTMRTPGNYPRLAWEERAGPLLTDPPRAYGGGAGTYADPYLIISSAHLVTLSRHPQDFGRHFRLGRDLDLADVQASLVPIGTLSVPFTGSFDGNGRTLRNLKHVDNKSSYVALFRSIRRSADGDNPLSGFVSNLHLRDASVLGNEYVAALAAHNEGEILFCTVAESTSKADQCAGGLVGHNGAGGVLLACESGAFVTLGGAVRREDLWRYAGGLVAVNEGQLMLCSSAGQVRGVREATPSAKPQLVSEYIGGLVGFNHEGTLTDCTSTALVAGFRMVAGLVALNESGWLYRCGAAGDVDGVEWAGGLLAESIGGKVAACSVRSKVTGVYVGGFISSSQDDDIESCYFRGSISGSTIGGFVNQGYGTTQIRDCYCAAAIAGTSRQGAFARTLGGSVQVSNCFWDKTVFPEQRNYQHLSELQTAGITGLETDALESGASLQEAGWDFAGTWVQCTGGYPRLWWEELECGAQP
jgi:hypothetical protein